MRRFVLTLSVILLTMIVVGCGKRDPDYFGTVRPLHPPDEIWVNNSNEPEWIDPGKCSDSTSSEIAWNCFSGLTEFHPKTLQPMPDIAKGWDVSEDGRRFTFYLRKTQWSDGVACTAHDFEWSWKRVLNPKTASKYGIMLHILRHGEPFNQKALMIRGIPEAAKDDDIRRFVEATIPVEKVTRGDSGTAFVFVTESEKKTRAQAIAQLHGKQLSGSNVAVAITDDSVVGVHALDDYTLQVDLEYPASYFLSLTSFYTYMPVPRHLLQRLEEEGQNPSLWTRAENLVCNGAYKMTEWKFRQYMIFERNDRYWNISAPHIGRLRKVKVLMIQSYNTGLNLYCAGEVDWTGKQAMVPAEFMTRMESYKDFNVSRNLAVYFYWFNTTEPPMDNPLVRKAFSLAIDREKMTKYVTRGGQLPLSSVVPDGLAGYQGLGLPIFDPAAAKQALADAGYPNGEEFPPVTLIYNTTEQHKQVASAAKQMWKDNLGIDVEIENQEWKVYLERMKQTDFQIGRMGWIGDYADPNTFLELLASNNGNNHSNWADEKYDSMLADANQTADAADRLRKLRKAEAYALKHQPILPMFVYTKSTMVKPFVKGLFPNEMDRHPWKYLSIDEGWYEGKPSQPEPNDVPPVVPNLGGS